MSPQVVIIGAGYAGVMAANRILSSAASSRPDVTVVNPRPDFVERIRLHQLAAGSGEATKPLASVLHPAARLLVGTVDRIDAAGHTLEMADGSRVPYDHLVYAVGSGAVGSGAVGSGAVGSGAVKDDHAFTIGTYEQAQALRQRLDTLDGRGRVVVVGGGLTAVETAAELAERRPGLDVSLVTAGFVAEGVSPAARRSITRRLGRLGITSEIGVRVTAVTEDKVTLSDGRVLGSDATVWAAGFAVPDLARRSGLPTDAAGRLRTDASLTCVGHPSIVGVGDAVAPPSEVAAHIRMSCQAALPLGAHGGDTVLAALAGAPPRPLSLGFVGQCISLGRDGGVFQPTHADDSPRRLALGGRVGRMVKERVCRFTVTSMTRTAAGGGYRWAKGPH